MKKPITNSNITGQKVLISPLALNKLIPQTERQVRFVLQQRQALVNILEGKDSRFIMYIGPCSIHDTVSALEYALKISELQSKCGDKILILLRAYFEKPRTTIGWKGLICEPDIDGVLNFEKGLQVARSLLRDITDFEVPVVTEFLDPFAPQYIGDFITSGAIGARTIESQTHRQMAGGLSMPIGYKHGIDGAVYNAFDAILAAQHGGHFIGINELGQATQFLTKGNRRGGYLILRGERGGVNYDPESVARTIDCMNTQYPQLKGTGIVIDCSHGNSNKDYRRQSIAFDSVIQQVTNSNTYIKGLMLESNHVEGKQDPYARPLIYGKSITDGCIGWKETVDLVMSAYKKL